MGSLSVLHFGFWHFQTYQKAYLYTIVPVQRYIKKIVLSGNGDAIPGRKGYAPFSSVAKSSFGALPADLSLGFISSAFKLHGNLSSKYLYSTLPTVPKLLMNCSRNSYFCFNAKNDVSFRQIFRHARGGAGSAIQRKRRVYKMGTTAVCGRK